MIRLFPEKTWKKSCDQIRDLGIYAAHKGLQT